MSAARRQPVHFDRDEFFASLQRIHDEATVVIQKSSKSDDQKALEIGTLPVITAFMRWVMDAKEAGRPHEVVAYAAGCLMAQLFNDLSINYACGCVPKRMLDAFDRQVSELATGKIKPGFEITRRGVRGGNS